GVGISFGADRIYDVLNELELYPKHQSQNTKVFFVNFGKTEEAYCLPILAKLRNAGVNAEIYPQAAKMKKQMKYANGKAIPFVAIIGEDEMQKGELMLKNMENGEQKSITSEDLLTLMTE
ncbi:MAG: histidine--tRNA ligase, partial [Bacteroidetes bacterium]